MGIKVRAGREVDLSGGDPLKAKKFDRKMAETKTYIGGRACGPPTLLKQM
jgi:hypothetical protein